MSTNRNTSRTISHTISRNSSRNSSRTTGRQTNRTTPWASGRAIAAGAGIALVALLASCGSQSNGLRAVASGSASFPAPSAADPTTTTATITITPVAPTSEPAAATASEPIDASATASPETATTEPATTVPTTPATPPPTDVHATPPAPPPPTVTVPPPSYRPIVAVNGNGDAVIVHLDGTETFLYDGTDPDERPEEGPSVLTAGVAVNADESITFVGTCCEPSPGTLLATSGGVTQTSFGHAPVISPDDTKVGFITFGTVSVSALDLTNPISASVAGTGGATPDDSAWVTDLAWVDDTHLVALVIDDVDGSTLHLFELGDSTLQAAGSVSIEPAVSLAGSDDGTVYTLTPAGVLKAYDAFLGMATPADDIVLADQALSADVHDGEVRWVDHDRGLHIGATRIFGEYIWVR